MGGEGSGRKPDPIKVFMKQTQMPVNPGVCNAMVLPNLSGDHSAGNLQKTPVRDIDLVNKKYVDSSIAAIPQLWEQGTGEIHPTTISDNVLIGTTTDDGTNKLQVNGDARIGNYFDLDGVFGLGKPSLMIFDEATTTSKVGVGIWSQSNNTEDPFASQNATGLVAVAKDTGTWPASNLVGLYGGAWSYAPYNPDYELGNSLVRGVAFSTWMRNGSHGTEVTTIDLFNMVIDSGSYVEDLYGLRIESPLIGSGGSVNNSYGIKIDDHAGATTNYAIKTGTGLKVFGDYDWAGNLGLVPNFQVNTLTTNEPANFGFASHSESTPTSNDNTPTVVGGYFEGFSSGSYTNGATYGLYGTAFKGGSGDSYGVFGLGFSTQATGGYLQTQQGINIQNLAYGTSTPDEMVGIELNVNSVSQNAVSPLGYGIRIRGTSNSAAVPDDNYALYVEPGVHKNYFGSLVYGSDGIGAFDVASLGAEKLTNGGFTGNANGWTLASGWTYNTNLVKKDGAGSGTLTQTNANMVTPIIPGEGYVLTYTISNFTAGQITPSCGGQTLPTRYKNGTFTETFIAKDATALAFTPTTASRYYIDNISLKKGNTGFLFAGGGLATENIYCGTDLNVSCGTAKTLTLVVPPYDEIYFYTGLGKVPAVNFPTWETFTTNTNAYSFAVNDYIDHAAEELRHWWKEGTAGDVHLHVTTKAANNSGNPQYAKFTVYVAYSDINGTWSETSFTQELTIPNGTAALKHLYLDMGDLTLTGYHIGGLVKVRVKRIAATGGTEYTGNIFINQCGIHLQKDTLGSRSETTK